VVSNKSQEAKDIIMIAPKIKLCESDAMAILDNRIGVEKVRSQRPELQGASCIDLLESARRVMDICEYNARHVMEMKFDCAPCAPLI
jgi:hypothetical protein